MKEEQRNALVSLGAYLTGVEAEEIAGRLEAGDTLSQALGAVQESRRQHVRGLLKAAGYGVSTDEQRQMTILGMRGIQGAHTDIVGISPVWTAPHLLADVGDLNSSRSRLVEDARSSIVCSTYNIQQSSDLWHSLTKMANEHPEVSIRLYVDYTANDGTTKNGSRSMLPREIATALPRANVFHTKEFKQGQYYRNHAKFISIDHQVLLVTSANFSYSADHNNIELGLKAANPNLAQMVENQMRRLEPYVYQRA